MSKRILLTLLLTLTALAAGAAAQESMLKDTTESKFKVGQVWSYETRPDEKGSAFVVAKVESHPKLGNIVHVSVRGLRMKKPNGEFISDIQHMPFSEEALAKSAVKLVKEKEELPDFEEGYQIWREAFDAGKAGVWTVSLAKGVEAMEKTLNQ